MGFRRGCGVTVLLASGGKARAPERAAVPAELPAVLGAPRPSGRLSRRPRARPGCPSVTCWVGSVQPPEGTAPTVTSRWDVGGLSGRTFTVPISPSVPGSPPAQSTAPRTRGRRDPRQKAGPVCPLQ